MLYLQKGNFQKVVRWMAGSWMSANQATLFGVFFIFMTAICFYVGLSYKSWRWLLLLVPIFLLFRMAMNALDGMLAREYGTGSVAGEICNEALDIVGDTICYGSLFFVPDPPQLSLTLFLFLSWMAEYVGVLGKGFHGGVRRHETFLGGKPDRAVWMGAMALIIYVRPQMEGYIHIYLLIVSCFVLMTSFVRVRKTIAESKGQNYESYTWIGK